MSNCLGSRNRPDHYWGNFSRGPRGPGVAFPVSSLVSSIALVTLNSGNTLLTIFAPFYLPL